MDTAVDIPMDTAVPFEVSVGQSDVGVTRVPVEIVQGMGSPLYQARPGFVSVNSLTSKSNTDPPDATIADVTSGKSVLLLP